jgi:hypothetical protein
VAAAAIVFVVLIAIAFYVVPNVLVPEGVLLPPDLQAARAAIRGNALQAVGAIAIAVGLMLTARSVTLATRSLAITREAQVGDRIAHAIDHLASDKVEVRLAGVYSLERIAQHSPVERDLIFEVISAFASAGSATRSQSDSETEPGVSARRDTAAALLVLGRWSHKSLSSTGDDDVSNASDAGP